jgi:hypothetical protein
LAKPLKFGSCGPRVLTPRIWSKVVQRVMKCINKGLEGLRGLVVIGVMIVFVVERSVLF